MRKRKVNDCNKMVWQFMIVILFYIQIINASNVMQMEQMIETAPKNVTKSSQFRFASYFADHMVLQGAPYKSTIWGFAPEGSEGDMVSVLVQKNLIYETLVKSDLSWSVIVGPFMIGGPYLISAKLGNSSIQITDVLFGDVWLCSGQSNMQFQLSQVFNASFEIKDALNYPDIRVFSVLDKTSDTPLTDITPDGIQIQWTQPKEESNNFTKFSAVCWLYGKYLYQVLRKPMGLVETSWGGTPVEAWSSPDALSKCGLFGNGSSKNPEEKYTQLEGPQDNSVLWNAMVHPLLKMSIYGAIWYQGESNANYNTDLYRCTFPTMIDDWRKQFHANGGSDHLFPFGFVQVYLISISEMKSTRIFPPHYFPPSGSLVPRLGLGKSTGFIPTAAINVTCTEKPGEANTKKNRQKYSCTFPAMIDDWRKQFHSNSDSNALFPFGFVQLAPNKPAYHINTGFAAIRWHQTADYGYVPNHRQRNVFMAVAMDLPDFVSPYTSIHPRDKQDVAARLVRGGLAIAYGQKMSFQGPFPVDIRVSQKDQTPFPLLTIEYSMNVTQKWLDGFEICCSFTSDKICKYGKAWWLPTATEVSRYQSNMTVSYVMQCKLENIIGIRYAWRDSPCPFKKCAVYGASNDLPVPPFKYHTDTFDRQFIDKKSFVVKVL